MIGICVRYLNKNYGSMLQIYATTKMLEQNKYDYEIIRYTKKKSVFSVVKNCPRLLNVILMNDKIEDLKKKFGIFFHPIFKKNEKIRSNRFRDFQNSEFTKLSGISLGYKELCENSKKYNIVLSGSDQLWSPAGLPTNFYNLQFCDEKCKRVSYASSFGVGYIPWYQVKRTRQYLMRMNEISVREKSGKNIIKKLIDRDVKLVVDPVLLLSKQEWDEYIRNNKVIKEKYIFAYFLGNNSECRKVAKAFAAEKKLKLVFLPFLDQYNKSDEKFGDELLFDVGPKDFLNLIRNAEYVLTDSFHGSIFSIIYHKNFLVFNRYKNSSKVSKNSRIDTLLNEFDLSERRYKNDVTEIDTKMNFEQIDNKILSLREYSLNYLKHAIGDQIND
jgi:polysaccharide pyruvyl transferase WcaK-like protein